jgi:integrase
MVVMIDAELDVLTAEAQRSPDGLDQVSLLSGLLTNSLIRRYRFAEDGPPPSVQPEIRAGVEVYPGWVVLTRDAPEGVHGVVFTDGPNSNSRSGVMGNACEIAANDVKTDAYADLPPGIARSRRQADALAAQVAIQGVGADIYVTEREFLHRRGGYVTSGVTVCSPAEALPLVSLYLRIQGEFRVRDDHTFNRGLFYWVGTREILPAAWRWITACHQHSTHSGQEPIFLLAGSLLQRVDRLGPMFRRALRDHLIREDPTYGVDAPGVPRSERFRGQALELNVWQQLLRVASERPLGASVVAAATLGARRGEILGLTWSETVLDHVDEPPHLTISRSMQRVTGTSGSVAEDPKNEYSKRTLAIPEMLVEALRLHRDSGRTGPDYIFVQPTDSSKAMDAGYHWSHVWKPIRDELDLKIRPHDLRSTLKTLLTTYSNVRSEFVDRYFGWSQGGMPSHYLQLRMAETKAVADAIDEMASGSLQ